MWHLLENLRTCHAKPSKVSHYIIGGYMLYKKHVHIGGYILH
jgi:hypothetical protein